MSPPPIDLTGDWIGYYAGHHDEVIRVTQRGNRVEAVKVTGDLHVPAGEMTFWAELTGREGKGEGQIAAADFHDPKFIPGRLRILDENHFVFEWIDLGSVEFRRDI
jgi:hypothetical protein